MRRVFIPALLAVALVATSSVNASAFGLFDHLCGRGHDACCDAEPVCGCEVIEPACGCEVAAPCCDAPCAAPKRGLLHRLFHHHNDCCDSVCAEPVCGCEVIVEPACGLEVAAPCCDAPCGGPKRGFLHRLFHHHDDCCDSGCAVIEPTCGCGF